MQNNYILILVIAAIASLLLAFVWLAYAIKQSARRRLSDDLVASAETDVEHIFSEEFREELRNRGRLHFENILNENAMFLQQDLRLTTSELNEYMKQEIKKVLKEEFEHYEESITIARDQAVESIQKTQSAVNQQRQMLEQQLKQEIEREKKELITRFENNLSEIVNRYILEAIGGEIDLSAQLDFIFSHLEANKSAIIEDIKSGA